MQSRLSILPPALISEVRGLAAPVSVERGDQGWGLCEWHLGRESLNIVSKGAQLSDQGGEK